MRSRGFSEVHRRRHRLASSGAFSSRAKTTMLGNPRGSAAGSLRGNLTRVKSFWIAPSDSHPHAGGCGSTVSRSGADGTGGSAEACRLRDATPYLFASLLRGPVTRNETGGASTRSAGLQLLKHKDEGHSMTRQTTTIAGANPAIYSPSGHSGAAAAPECPEGE